MVIVKLKTESHSKQKTSPQSYKTQINILPFPELAQSGTEQPGQRATLLGWPKSIYYGYEGPLCYLLIDKVTLCILQKILACKNLLAFSSITNTFTICSKITILTLTISVFHEISQDMWLLYEVRWFKSRLGLLLSLSNLEPRSLTVRRQTGWGMGTALIEFLSETLLSHSLSSRE